MQNSLWLIMKSGFTKLVLIQLELLIFLILTKLLPQILLTTTFRVKELANQQIT